jgi:S1-C subfamily serine protease
MKRYFPWLLIIFILVFNSLACQLTTAIPKQSSPVIVVTPPSTASLPQKNPDLEYQDTLLTTLYEKVDPGIVSIQVLSDSGGSLGSGFVFDKLGHVITNYHVVEGAQDLEVDFVSGIKVRGKVVGKDLDSDIAVINISAPAEALFPLEMGDSDQIKVGQAVIAIGNPFGLTGTMTTGIVSARGRTLDSLRQTPEGGTFTAGGLIQTDAAINPGNSGGPLLDLKGRVIGINRAIRTTTTTQQGEPANSGVGFAVPVNIVKRVVPVLIEKGSYDYPYLGISTREEISLIEQEALGLSQSSGAYILDVVPGGPADQAGLKGGNQNTSISGLPGGGDLITAIDNRPVRVFGDMLTYLMENKSPGDTIHLTILRANQQKEVAITLGKRP